MTNENPDHVQDRVAQVGAALPDFEIDFESFKIWPVLDPSVHYKKEVFDNRQDLKVMPGVDLPDYSGPFKADLRFTDFSREQLVNMLAMNDEYLHVWVGAWLDEVEDRFGRDERLDLEWAAWRDGMVPEASGDARRVSARLDRRHPARGCRPRPLRG